MKKLYEFVKEDPNIDVETKILTALFDHQGQVKRMALFQYIKKYEDMSGADFDTTSNVLIKKSKIRMDPDTTMRINVDGFNYLKDFFAERFPNVEELKPEDVIVRVILNSNGPSLSKIATKVYARKTQYTRDLQNVNTYLNGIKSVLDKYRLTTKPLEDPNNDLNASQLELLDTAKSRQEIDVWSERFPKSMKLAFKLQLRQFGDDRVLKAIYDEIYQYEKWSLKSSMKNLENQ
jgi:hypothetical protein